MNSNSITKFLLLINYLIIYRIIYYAINDTNLYIVNHIKPNKSTEYIKIIKKKKNETIITILPRHDESQFDENRAPRRRATNGEQRTAMKVTVFGRYLDLEARSTAMEVA